MGVQAVAPKTEHSLHVTVSTYQLNSWGEYLKTLLPAALDMAAAEDVRFRAGLPVNFLSYMGVLHADKVHDGGFFLFYFDPRAFPARTAPTARPAPQGLFRAHQETVPSPGARGAPDTAGHCFSSLRLRPPFMRGDAQAEDPPLDAAADQLGLRFLHDSLPPCLTPAEIENRRVPAGL